MIASPALALAAALGALPRRDARRELEPTQLRPIDRLVRCLTTSIGARIMGSFKPKAPKPAPQTPAPVVPQVDDARESAQVAADNELRESRTRRGLAANILTSEQGLAGVRGGGGRLRIGARRLLGE